MAESMQVFFQVWLVSLISEFGDKTFLLAIVFSTWCPWLGVRKRDGPEASWMRFLVAVGTSVALSFRMILMMFGVNPFSYDFIAAFMASIITFALAFKASMDEKAMRGEDGEAEPVMSMVKKLAEGEDGFAGDEPTGMAPTDYGGTPSTPPDKDSKTPILDMLGRVNWTEVLLTSVLPGVTVFFAEAMDKSTTTLEPLAMDKRPDLALGACIGFTMAEFIAVFCGVVIRRQLPARLVLVLVNGALWLVAVLCFRDAVLRLLLAEVPRSSGLLLQGVTGEVIRLPR